MGFCTEAEYAEFLHSCPEFERMLVRAGIMLMKYWFSVSHEEQEHRFQDRMKDATKRWKISPMDLESRKRWAEYSRAKDEMFAVTDIKQAPWHVVERREQEMCSPQRHSPPPLRHSLSGSHARASQTPSLRLRPSTHAPRSKNRTSSQSSTGQPRMLAVWEMYPR